MISDATKKILNKIAIGGMVLFFLMALLLPQPYIEGRVVVFEQNGVLNVTAVILFELLMFVLFGWSYTLFYFTRVVTIDDVKNTIMWWSRENNLNAIHTILNPLPEFIVEAKTLEDKERIRKQREQIRMLKTLWEQEKNNSQEQDDEIEKLQKELDELKMKEIKEASEKRIRLKDAFNEEKSITDDEYADIFGN